MGRSASEDPQADWIASHCGARPVQRRPVSGGCIHQAWRLELEDGRLLFAKGGPAEALPVLSAEADGLTALASAAAAELVVPRPLALGVVEGQALLLLPWLSLAAQGPPAAWARFGAALAGLHRRSLEAPLVPGDCGAEVFGWCDDNVIGSSPQCNRWTRDWGTFFAECRLAPQLQWLQRATGSLPGADALLEQVPRWLSHHGARPCLVHGDLWSGNASLLQGDAAALFDPAVHRADREVDLAMARLFGGFPSAFFAGYEQAWPLPAGHQRRVDLYNLYHLLNHANLFGGGYRARCCSLIAGLLRQPPP